MILPPLYSNFTPKLDRAPLQLKLSRKKGKKTQQSQAVALWAAKAFPTH